MFFSQWMTYLDASTCCIFATVFSLSYWLLRLRSPGMPSGPFPLPVLGNFLTFRKGPMDVVFMEWRKQYGDIYLVRLGSQRTVVVCGYENIKELYTKTNDEFLDRPYLYLADKATRGSKGVLLSNGARWHETRRFSLMAMRDFGLGRQSLRDKIVEEANAFCALLAQNDLRIVDVKPLLTNSVSNVICSVVFGHRFALDDGEFVKVMKAFEKIVQGGGARALANFIPWMRFVPFMVSFDEEMADVESVIRKEIKEHRGTFDAARARDFIDLYLQVEGNNLEFDKSIFDEDHMFVLIFDLFLAGTETSASTLLWGILLLSLNTDVQKRCREEIRSVLGADGTPEMEHRQEMPFVEATLLEIQRVGDITAVGVFRTATKDTTFKGYRIPKGTMMVPLLHSVHHDDRAWPEPDRFRPERWLDEQGKVVHHEQFIPFSLGRRNCIGENLAKVELFVFFAMMFQRFAFSIPVGYPRPTLDGIVGATRTPHPFKVLIRKVD